MFGILGCLETVDVTVDRILTVFKAYPGMVTSSASASISFWTATSSISVLALLKASSSSAFTTFDTFPSFGC